MNQKDVDDGRRLAERHEHRSRDRWGRERRWKRHWDGQQDRDAGRRDFGGGRDEPKAGPAPLECTRHVEPEMRATEALLLRDLVDVFVVDLPTSEIVPILLFFEEEKAQRAVEAPVLDNRYMYFLKRALPAMHKSPNLALKHIEEQRAALLERAANNRAEIPRMTGAASAPKNVIPGIPAIRGAKWSGEEERAFRMAVLRYGNDFRKITAHVAKDTGACILKYYLSKNKTFSYIKRRPGRMSDSEIKLIVENEWSAQEISAFLQHLEIFGKNWERYQTLISKPEKDLRIFFRYYTKFMAQKEAVPRRSVSKTEILQKWTIDERQIFAIYFPYYNRNWISMATYFPSKTSGDLRQYYNRYYKGLSYNEQRLEASLYNFGRQVSTPPARHVGTREEIGFCESAGVLFRRL